MSRTFRYKTIFSKVNNWRYYLKRKVLGFKDGFVFEIADFGRIKVDEAMLGPFRENFFDDIYFKHIPDFIFKNKSKPRILDIGANVGFFSLAAFMKFPEAEIYSFEPHPYCFKIMSDYKQMYEQYNWHILKEAVSDHDGGLVLNTETVSGFTTQSSVFNSQVKQESFSAKTTLLESFLFENSIQQIDFIKLDCEGAEYSIIYSLSDESFSKIDSMCIETHKGEFKDQNMNYLNKFLIKKGYSTKLKKESHLTGYIWAWKQKN